jgi:Tfp pilus assembly protein PilX
MTAHDHDANGRPERGAALIGAVMILGILAVFAVILLISLGSHVKIAGRNVRSYQAVGVAEAGVVEALSRIKAGTVPDNGNAKQVTQIFLAASGSQPSLGTDSTAIVTGQPSGAWLNYSTAARSSDALTIAYKTNSARTQIYRYSASSNPRIQTGTGNPLFVITSTGTVGTDRCRIRAEVVSNAQPPFTPNVKAALVADVDVKITGNAFMCGYNHRSDTPSGTGSNGRAGAGGCNEDASVKHWEVGSSDIAGCWTTQSIKLNGGAADDGVPAQQEAQAGFYAGPWEALGITKTTFFNWVGTGQSSLASGMDGIIYLDNNSTAQDQSGSWTLHDTGSGLLYVDGDATLNAGFTYRGLIYIEGDLKLNGSAWILGAVIVRGRSGSKVNGGATVLYSKDAITDYIKDAGSGGTGGDFTTITWREIPH